ncbi:hypothetical protein V6N13_054622 [Hibiscus sabdariffa]|uniref:Uncharacterized protein n=1 Tax=Hibiscus sabdariffa TaxID=183260 RepID=A0ABR2DX89_9ROSI
MGNEMGNNNTSGLREDDNTVEDKPVQGLIDDSKGPNGVVPATGDKEEVNMKTEGGKSPEDAGRMDYEKEQKHEVDASEDIHVLAKVCFSIYDGDEEVKGQDHLVPAAETEPAFLEHDGLASPLIENWEHDDKEQDNSSILEVEEIPLNEAASTNETNAASLVPAVGDESTHGTELVFSGRDGTEYPCVDERKYDENAIETDAEKSIATKDEAEEAKGQDRLVPGAEDKNIQGDETESASLQHDGLASICSEDPKHDQKEQDTSTIDEIEEIALKESSSTEETNAEACLVPAGGDESTRRTETGLILGDCHGMEHSCLDKLKPEEKEEDININDQTVEQSSQEASSTDVIDRQGQLLALVDDKATYGNETCLVSSDPEGTADIHGDNSKEHEKEEDNNMIPVDKEDSMQEAGYAEEEKGQDHLFPAAQVNEIGSASLNHNGLASPRIEDLEHGEKDAEQDTSTVLAVEETSLKEGASTDETNAEGCLVPAGGDENSHGTETGPVLGDHDGMEYPSVDEQKHDEKEEDITINGEAEEESSQEAASTDMVDRRGQLLAVVEGKTSNGNETGLVSSGPDGTADIRGDKLKEHEKEVNNTNAEPQEKPLEKDDHEDDIEEKKLTIPAVEGEDCNNKGAELASGEPEIVGDTLDNQTVEGKEQAKTELDPPAESTEYDLEPSEVAGECSETQPDSSLKNLEDHEMKKEPNSEENLSAGTQHVESQNPMMEEGEGTSDSTSGAASPTSHESVSLEPVVILETEEHELVEILTEQLVLECNGPVKSEDLIIPCLTCRDQENGFLLDSCVSSDPVESVFPDRSLEAGKGRDVILAEEMASKRVSTEEKFELKYGGDVGTVTTVMTDLAVGVGAKYNGELPSEINSTKTDSPESEVEAILSNETQNILVEASESEFEEKGTSVKEDSDNGKQAHCQIQSGEVLIEKPNGQATILENGHSVEQQKNSQEVQLATDSAETFPMDQINRKEETEKKIIEDMIGKKEDTNPIANDTPRRENEEQFISHSYDPIEQTEAFLSPSPFLQALLEKQESSGEFSSSVNKTLTEKIVVPIEFYGEKSLTLSETKVIANGDHNNQRESVERLSIQSNPDNTTMRKSPSFDLDLRIDARADDSDQTPLLYQDKTTIGSFSSQPDITEKSKTPFLGFKKEDEEADNNNNMLMNPKKQDDQSATKKTTTPKVSVSVKAVMSGKTKGKVKRKPRASLFGTCMCCATV